MANSYLTNLFGRSPIRPLQEHMSKVFGCVSQLKPLLQAMVDDDQDEVRRIQRIISQLENDADSMKKELRNHLPKGLFMPIDRRDLLELLLMQDNIANRAKDIAGLIVGRKMTVPKAMHTLFLQYGDCSINAVAKALDVINELDELLETGFRGLEVERVEEMITEINTIESETDKNQVELRDMLFAMEDDLRPTDVMFTYRLLEWIGNVGDYAEKVGSRLQLLLAK
ncbi:MAG: TIGR00153 family protein [Gammaproteobacteria bacterium]|nr:TIGR00153 family protein [Gammaproteobacteria bacterium]